MLLKIDINQKHFTTYCKQENGQWLKFDDKNVSHIPEELVHSSNAYILFYQKRTENIEHIKEKYFIVPTKTEKSSCTIM